MLSAACCHVWSSPLPSCVTPRKPGRMEGLEKPLNRAFSRSHQCGGRVGGVSPNPLLLKWSSSEVLSRVGQTKALHLHLLLFLIKSNSGQKAAVSTHSGSDTGAFQDVYFQGEVCLVTRPSFVLYPGFHRAVVCFDACDESHFRAEKLKTLGHVSVHQVK